MQSNPRNACRFYKRIKKEQDISHEIKNEFCLERKEEMKWEKY